MNTDMLKFPIISDMGPLQKKDIPIIINETEKLTPGTMPSKRFRVVDLWNVRKKGRYFSIYGKDT